MLLRPGSFPCSLSVNHHCTGQHPRNDPSPGGSQPHPWAARIPLALLLLHLLPLRFPLGVISARKFGFSCLCGPQRHIPPRHRDGEHTSMAGRVGNLLLPGALVPWAATSILPRLLAAGSLLTPQSLISCNTACVADTGHFGLELGPVTLFVLSGSWCF